MNWQERAEKAEAELVRLGKQKPVGEVYGSESGPFVILQYNAVMSGTLKVGDKVYVAPVPAVANMRDAYEGAREDLLDWKRRALEAEAELAKLREQEPVKYERFNPVFDCWEGCDEATARRTLEWRELYTAPVPAVADMRDAYEGAREDLLDWKRRALEAERKLDHVLNDTQGAVKFGEPVPAVAAPAVPVSIDAAADRLLEGGE